MVQQNIYWADSVYMSFQVLLIKSCEQSWDRYKRHSDQIYPFCQVNVVDGKCACSAPISRRALAKPVCIHWEDLRAGKSKPKSKWGELKMTPGLEKAEQQWENSRKGELDERKTCEAHSSLAFINWGEIKKEFSVECERSPVLGSRQAPGQRKCAAWDCGRAQ